MNAITPTTNALGTPIVFAKDGKVFTNSRDVATFFGKQHYVLLRTIDELVGRGVDNFVETPEVNPQNGQTYRAFDMDRDGFTLLVMGFTGQKALKFKIAYIAAYNRMEQELNRLAPQLPDFTDPASAAEAWAAEYRHKQVAQEQVKQLEPHANAGKVMGARRRSVSDLAGKLPGVNLLISTQK